MQNKSPFTSAPVLFSLMLGLCFYWGVLTLMNDLLVPVFKSEFKLDYLHATLVDFGFFISYLLFAFPAVALINRINYKKSLMTGLLILILGSLLVVLALVHHVFYLSIVALFILGCGVVFIQIVANPVMDQLGCRSTATARLSLGHAFTALGFAITPILISAYINMQSIKFFYVGVAVVMFISLLWVKLNNFSLPELIVKNDRVKDAASNTGWRSPIFIGCLLGIFCYVGAEVSIGSLLVNYLKLPQIVNFSMQSAVKYLTVYWGGAMLGRFIGARLFLRIRPAKILFLHALMNILLLIGVIVGQGYFAMWCLLLIGLFNSIMFPVIFSFGLSCFQSAEHKNIVSAALSMATCGAALVPVVQGWLADLVGLQHSFGVLILCYCYIAVFGYYVLHKAKRSTYL